MRTFQYSTNRQDRVVWWFVNLLLRLATEEYRSWLKGAIEYGLSSAARDVREGNPAPPNWKSPCP